MEKQLEAIKQQIHDAIEHAAPLQIRGGNSKLFIGRDITGNALEMRDYQGIICYEPTELFITVKAGTLLSEVKHALAEKHQMLAFEPPEVTENTTIGGVVATGLSGPRRAYTGSVRDYVLGIRCFNGLGQDLSFGGQVMKNVAGYDLSRLLTGSFGTLGVILEVSLKVIPVAEYEMTCYRFMPFAKALATIHQLSSQVNPISGSCYDGEALYIRLSGNEKVVKETHKMLAFYQYQDGPSFWDNLRDYKANFFNSDEALWRLSVPSTTILDFGNDAFLMDWGGSQYWLKSMRPPHDIFAMASGVGGSALLFRGGDCAQNIFQPLAQGLLKLQQALKQAFDPHQVLNPGKMYADL